MQINLNLINYVNGNRIANMRNISHQLTMISSTPSCKSTFPITLRGGSKISLIFRRMWNLKFQISQSTKNHKSENEYSKSTAFFQNTIAFSSVIAKFKENRTHRMKHFIAQWIFNLNNGRSLQSETFHLRSSAITDAKSRFVSYFKWVPRREWYNSRSQQTTMKLLLLVDPSFDC